MASGAFTPAIKLLGVSSASFCAAWIASFSIISVPAIKLAPSDLAARQWSEIFHIGMSTAPPFAITSCACFAYLAYQGEQDLNPNLTSSWQVLTVGVARHARGRFPIRPMYLYGAAAVLAPCIVPYTRAVMWKGIQALELKAAGKAGAPSDQATKELIEVWTAQNMNRSSIVGAAAVLAAVAMIS